MNLGKIGVIVEDRSPGMLQSIGFQKVGQDLATEQQQQNKISLKKYSENIKNINSWSLKNIADSFLVLGFAFRYV